MKAKFESTTNVDGNILPTEQASVPVTDRGFLYGDSVYEVFRTYSGVPLFFDEHWTRLQNSARLISMKLNISKEIMAREIQRTIESSGALELDQDVYVRYAITRGDGPFDLYPEPNLSCRFVITVKEVPRWNPKFYSDGVKLAVTEIRRNADNALSPSIKGGNYLNNVLAVLEARRKGADDCIMLNQAGLVTEASNSNIFFVIDGDLVTPSPSVGILNGLTKQAIQDAHRSNGAAVIERDIDVNELAGATECFLSSATREVMPVSQLCLEDGRAISFPKAGGEVTRKTQALYRDAVAEHISANASPN